MILLCPNLPPGSVDQGFSQFIWFQNLPIRGLLVKGAACLYSLATYLQGSVDLGCSIFIRFPNLHYWDCWSGMQPVYTASGPI